MVRVRSNSAPQRRSWIPSVKISRYKNLHLVIGAGTFSTVSLYYDNAEQRYVAIKKIKKRSLPSKYYTNEINILSNINHHSIVKYYGSTLFNGLVSIILEYIPGINFFDYISKTKPIKDRDLCDLFTKIFDAVDYLHDLNIVHRDIKLENMVYNYRNNEIKLVDFGFACYDDGTDMDRPGSFIYCSPDIFFIKKIITWKPVDIWCLGISLYMSITLHYPYWDGETCDFSLGIFDNDPSYPVHSNISNRCVRLVKSMLQKDPNCRPTIKDIINGKWIAHQKLNKEETQLSVE